MRQTRRSRYSPRLGGGGMVRGTRAIEWALAGLLVGGCYEGSRNGPGATAGPDAADDDGDGDGDGDGDDGQDDGAAADCDQSVTPLRRLSEAQYRNALQDLFAPVGVDVGTEIEDDLDRIPVDDASGVFRILDTRVSDLHVRAYYRIADSLSYVTVSDASYVSAMAPGCDGATPLTATCIDAFADGFAMRAYRRPLTGDERDRLHAIAADEPDGNAGLRAMVFSVLMAPQFLYHVQVDGEGTDESFDLDGYEVASRLSFHFWQSMPDDALFAAAADGSLLTDEGFAAELDRVFEDPRTQTTVDRFYGEWLQLGWLTQFPQTAAFDTFAAGTTIGDPDADHLQAAQDEILALTRYYTWEAEGTVADLLTTDRSFTASPHLAAIYGVAPWDGTSEPPVMPEGERAGILTRTALLVTGTHETHPVHRGAQVRRRILCDALPSPDPSALPDGALDPPPIDGEQTTRQRFEAKTADAACATCHDMINPIGFVLERYDALGRVRDEELVIDDLTGEVLATLPIDSQAAPRINGEDTVIGSGIELSQQVAASGKAETCFARQYFRATFGREETPTDACVVDRVSEALVDGGSIKSALRAVAESPMFRSRRVQ
ncbi:MAG: DUF1592 domain-containing protein [Myxococcota bacterium]